jgi:hypothetical protein
LLQVLERVQFVLDVEAQRFTRLLGDLQVVFFAKGLHVVLLLQLDQDTQV